MKNINLKYVVLVMILLVYMGTVAHADNDKATDYFNQGNVKEANADHDGAIADYAQAITLNPQYMDAYISRGVAKAHKGDQDGAIVDYNKVIEMNSKHALAYLDRGYAKYAKGDYDGAIADGQKALALEPAGKMFFQALIDKARLKLNQK